MNSEEEIKVINKCDNISEEYKIMPLMEIHEKNLVELLGKQEDEKRISNIKLKEDYIIILSTKISKNSLEINTTNDKNINISGFDIKIIKLRLRKEEKSSEWKEININIPLKEAKLIPNNTLINKYFFYDFIKIDDIKSYLHIFVFGQLHIYKIYQKDEQLKYNKIELKKFNDKTKVLYLGENHKAKDNILEISLLLKPMNVFMFLQISTDDKCPKIEERKYEFTNKNARNILYKFIRSYCGIFLFFEKESEKKYIIYKEEKNENQSIIQIKEAKIDIIDNYNNYFYTIGNKLYFITELPSEEENNNNYVVLGIFHLFLDKGIYYSKLIQKIKVRNEGAIKNYIINVNSLNFISIQIGEILFFIHLDEKSSVDMINKFYLNSKFLQISNIISDKSTEWSILLSYKNSKLYLSTFYDDKNNHSVGKCIKNYDKNKIEDDGEDVEDSEEEEEENCETEEKESEKDIESEEIKNGNTDIENADGFSKNIKPKIEDYIDKIINERVKINNEKVEKIKKEYDAKFEMIQKDIEMQEKENEKLENDVKNILNLISDLQKFNNEADEKENNNNENNKQFAKKNLMFKNDVMNLMQYNNFRQWNQMKMINQYNLMNPDNFFINSQMPLNDPRFNQIFNQNRNMLNQGNFFFKKMNK